jgi:hypothetical protein
LFENKDLPSIFAFPKGESAWRIDWFGEIAFPDRTMRRTQPSVLVHLSRVIDEDYQANPSVLLNPASTTPSQVRRKIWVSVGTGVFYLSQQWLANGFSQSVGAEIDQYVGRVTLGHAKYWNRDRCVSNRSTRSSKSKRSMYSYF